MDSQQPNPGTATPVETGPADPLELFLDVLQAEKSQKPSDSQPDPLFEGVLPRPAESLEESVLAGEDSGEGAPSPPQATKAVRSQPPLAEIVELRSGVRKWQIVAALELALLGGLCVGFLAIVPLVYLYQAQLELDEGDAERAREKLRVGRRMAGLTLF